MTSSFAWCLGGCAAIVVTAVTDNPMVALIAVLLGGLIWSAMERIDRLEDRGE
jgi:hypothetical protein